MQNDFKFPIKKIGEVDWTEKLQKYLQQYDIERIGFSNDAINRQEKTLGIVLPEDMREYYLNFGSIDSSDFMYGLKSIEQLQLLFAANIGFISSNFKMYQINSMIIFALSPGNDPLCFDKDSGEIYIFSHDPIKKARIFSNFNQYLLYEMIELEKLLGDNIGQIDEDKITKEFLAGEGIDYDFRVMKLQ
jgi:SMI1 / KNR4 family (SUKH-1)